jgi:hypothetical protein
MNWEQLFRDLLDEIEQVPHPMAEKIWDEYRQELE